MLVLDLDFDLGSILRVGYLGKAVDCVHRNGKVDFSLIDENLDSKTIKIGQIDRQKLFLEDFLSIG